MMLSLCHRTAVLWNICSNENRPNSCFMGSTLDVPSIFCPGITGTGEPSLQVSLNSPPLRQTPSPVFPI